MRFPLPLLALTAAVLTVAAACGDASGGGDAPATLAGQPEAPVVTTAPSDGATEPTTAATPAPAASSDLPDVAVVNLAGGDDVRLTSLAPSDRPILLWFWAPH